MYMKDFQRVKILHIWDTKIDTNNEFTEIFNSDFAEQRVVSRVNVGLQKNLKYNEKFVFKLASLETNFPKNRILRWYSRIKFKIIIHKSVKEFQPDLVYFHFLQTAALNKGICIKLGIPFVTGVYGHDIGVGAKSIIWRNLYRHLNHQLSYFFVLSNGVQSILQDFGIANNHIFIQNFPLKIEKFLEIPFLNLEAKTFKIIIPGRFTEKKGHEILFNSIKQIEKEFRNIELIAIGYGDEQYIYDLLKKTALETKIRIINTLEATSDGSFNTIYSQVLAEASLVVLPSVTAKSGDNEAGPALVLCLAQAAGRPVIASNFDGHEVTIKHLETGIVVGQKDVTDLSDKIRWAINRPIELQKIAIKGKYFVSVKFDSNEITKEYQTAILRILNDRGR